MQAMISAYNDKLSVIENNIHMTKNQSRQDPLNYGIRINNRIAFLLADAQRGDYPPTKQAQAFFKEVLQELAVEEKALQQLIETHTQKINSKVGQSDIKILASE